MEVKPGDKITITVDGRPYETYIDDRGVQRFSKDTTHPLWDRWKGDSIGREGRGTEDMNDLARAYSRGEFDQRTYMEFNMSVGYSVGGFCELSSFHDLRLINPVWDETEFDEPNDDYLYTNMKKGVLTMEDILQTIMRREGILYDEAQRYFVKQFMLLEDGQDYDTFSIQSALSALMFTDNISYAEAQAIFVENMKEWWI